MKAGTYTAENNAFFIEGKKYCIRDRKKATTKPKKFLISLQPFQYISSLFPLPGEEGLYKFDTKNKLYKLKQEENSIRIEPL